MFFLGTFVVMFKVAQLVERPFFMQKTRFRISPWSLFLSFFFLIFFSLLSGNSLDSFKLSVQIWPW